MTLRRWALVAAALIAFGAFEPFYFKIFTIRGDAMSAMLTELPYKKNPGLRTFLNDVRTHTHHGDAIAIASPYAQWDGGYDYVYARAMYLLAGRRVLALLDTGNRPQPQNLAQAEYIAAYHVNVRFSQFTIVWSGPDGILLRRAR